MTKEELFSVFRLIGFNKIEKNIHKSLPISIVEYDDLEILLYEASDSKLQEKYLSALSTPLKQLFSISLFSKKKVMGAILTIYEVDLVDPNFKLKQDIIVSTNISYFNTKRGFLDYLISYGFVYIKSNERKIKLDKISN